jgi:hypothetical protein
MLLSNNFICLEGEGGASVGGVLLAGCSEKLPPTYGNVLRMGDVLTYKAQRLGGRGM